MSKRNDLTGQKFNRLTVTEFAKTANGNSVHLSYNHIFKQ